MKREDSGARLIDRKTGEVIAENANHGEALEAHINSSFWNHYLVSRLKAWKWAAGVVVMTVVSIVSGTVGALNWLDGFVDKKLAGPAANQIASNSQLSSKIDALSLELKHFEAIATTATQERQDILRQMELMGAARYSLIDAKITFSELQRLNPSLRVPVPRHEKLPGEKAEPPR